MPVKRGLLNLKFLHKLYEKIGKLINAPGVFWFIASAKAEANKIVEKANAEIKEEKEKALGEIRDEAAALAISAASKLIDQSLDDDAHKKLVDKYIEEAGEVQ